MTTSRWTIGKVLAGFLPLGRMFVTTHDVPGPQALRIKATITCEVMQTSSSSDMIFTVAEIVS